MQFKRRCNAYSVKSAFVLYYVTSIRPISFPILEMGVEGFLIFNNFVFLLLLQRRLGSEILISRLFWHYREQNKKSGGHWIVQLD